MEDFKTEGLVEKFRGAFDQVDWGAFGGKITDGIVAGTEKLVSVGAQLFEAIAGADWEGLGTRIGTAAEAVLERLLSRLGDVLKGGDAGPDVPGTGVSTGTPNSPFSGSGEGILSWLGPTGNFGPLGPLSPFRLAFSGLKGFISGLFEEEADAAITAVQRIPPAIRSMAPSFKSIGAHVTSAIRTIAPTFDEISAKAGEMGTQVAAGISLIPPAARNIAPTFKEIGASVGDVVEKRLPAIRQVGPAFDDVTRRAGFVCTGGRGDR